MVEQSASPANPPAAAEYTDCIARQHRALGQVLAALNAALPLAQTLAALLAALAVGVRLDRAVLAVPGLTPEALIWPIVGADPAQPPR